MHYHNKKRGSDGATPLLLGGYDCKKAESGAYVYKLKDGRKLELSVTIK